MLVATRDEPRADVRHFGPSEPPRSMASRFTGAVQLVGSIIGIPLALIGGYSTYHVTFSPEAKCQSLRAGIITMLDKKADATTLRLLVQRDVAAFQHDCESVDPDAVAAFKTLLTAEKAPAVRQSERAKSEAVALAPAKVEPAKAVPAAKVEAVARHEPKKTPAPVVKREADKPAQEAKPVEAKPVQEVKAAEPKPAELKPAEAKVAEPKPMQDAKPAEVKAEDEIKAAETVAAKPDSERIDTAWVTSVREALRESASRPPSAETTTELAAPMPPPIVVTPQSKIVRDSWSIPTDGLAAPVPPADIPNAPKADRPTPPAPIPNGEANAQRGG